MQINCEQCKEPFEIPDKKAITSAYCPFCEHTNEITKTKAPLNFPQVRCRIFHNRKKPKIAKIKDHSENASLVWGLVVFVVVMLTAIAYQERQNAYTEMEINAVQTIKKILGNF